MRSGIIMPDCAERQQCDSKCFAHGHCDRNKCICDQGWFGTNCVSHDSHVSKGSNQSVLRAHSSDCYPAHAGASAPPCSGQGVCVTEHGCVCDPLVYGKHCQFSVCPGVEHCNKECCGNGACDPTVSNPRSRFDSLTRPLLNAICSLQNGKCICKDGWEGSDCYFRSCPGGCSGNGACNALAMAV